MVIELASRFLQNLWQLSLEAAPWLVLGLVVAGLLKTWLSVRVLGRWLGGRGLMPILRAALIGTPLPLCSCSVIPAAVELRRGGASRGSTVSFMIATPENGADSIALSYALLGPVMTVVRPIAAIFSAIFAGWLTSLTDAPESNTSSTSPTSSTAASSADACCATGNCCASSNRPPRSSSITTKTMLGLRYALGDLFRDIVGWLALGLMLAALMNTFIPPDALAGWSGGAGAVVVMVVMLLAGVPMYICATASTPVAAAMLVAGVSPGAVLVFLLAGPATNAGTIGIVWRQLGRRALATYLVGIAGGAVACGVALDALLAITRWSINSQAGAYDEWMPVWISLACLILLLAATANLLATHCRSRAENASPCHHTPTSAPSGELGD